MKVVKEDNFWILIKSLDMLAICTNADPLKPSMNCPKQCPKPGLRIIQTCPDFESHFKTCPVWLLSFDEIFSIPLIRNQTDLPAWTSNHISKLVPFDFSHLTKFLNFICIWVKITGNGNRFTQKFCQIAVVSRLHQTCITCQSLFQLIWTENFDSWSHFRFL